MRKRKIPTVLIPIGSPGKDGKQPKLRVAVTDAKVDVEVNGSAAHALRAARGVTVGCALSITFQENAAAFPHPVLLAHVIGSRAYLCDKQDPRTGLPTHCFKYQHSYKDVTSMNDTGKWKKMVRENPSLMDRPFKLRTPRPSPASGSRINLRPAGSPKPKAAGAPHVTRGALKRAIDANFITKEVDRQLNAQPKPKLRPKKTPAPAQPNHVNPDLSEQGYA